MKEVYFYNAAALAEELKEGKVSELRAVKHMAIVLMLGGLGLGFPINIQYGEETISLLNRSVSYSFVLVCAIITYYGVWWTHQVNSKGDSKDYFLRFAALSLPVGVQVTVFFIAIGVVFTVASALIFFALGHTGSILATTFYWVIEIAFIITFFIRMRRYISIAAGVNEA